MHRDNAQPIASRYCEERAAASANLGLAGMEKEGFWFPLAAGTIGGLIMSVIGVFIFLPVFTLKKKCLVKPKAML